jgi:hypothetical protein
MHGVQRHGATRDGRERHRGSGHGIRQLGDDEDVVLTEGEVERLDLAPEALDGLGDRRLPAGTAVLHQALEAFSRVVAANEVLGHGSLLGKSPPS